MQNVQTKVIEVTYLTASSGAYAVSSDGSYCYISTAMRDSHNVAVGDRYFATVKDNYDAHIEKIAHIAIRLHIDHPETHLVDQDEIGDFTLVDFEDDTTSDQTTDTVVGDVIPAPAARTLVETRDQMFSILLGMSEGELSDMVIDILSTEAMGFVDVLWSLLSISPIRHKDMSESQRKCYTRVHNVCMALHKAGKLVEAKYTTFNADGKSHTSVVYAVSQRMVDPTLD